jgi:hypothetical protein
MYTLHTDLKLQSGDIIPAGTKLDISIPKDKPFMAYCSDKKHVFIMPSLGLHRFFEDFHKFPVKNMLKSKSSISLIGKEVNEDGWDENGFPSVHLAGIIDGHR